MSVAAISAIGPSVQPARIRPISPVAPAIRGKADESAAPAQAAEDVAAPPAGSNNRTRGTLLDIFA